MKRVWVVYIVLGAALSAVCVALGVLGSAGAAGAVGAVGAAGLGYALCRVAKSELERLKCSSAETLEHCKNALSARITDLEQMAAVYEHRLTQQNLMSALSQNFILSGYSDTQVKNALSLTGGYLNLARVQLVSQQYHSFNCVAEWISPNTKDREPISRSIQVTAREKEVTRAFSDRTITSYQPTKQETDELCQIYGIDNLYNMVMFPIFVKEKFWGVLTFCKPQNSNDFSEEDIVLGEMIAGLLTGAITRKELQHDLVRMSSIVRWSPQYISYINRDGAFEFLNPATHNITGYSKEELIEYGIELLYAPETNHKIHSELLPELFKKGTLQFELPLIRKDGQIRIMHFFAFTIPREENACGTIAVDVTEQRKLERELITAKEQAEQNSRSKSEFLSRMSHEMRTPLNAIIGMASIGKSADSQERKDYCLEKIDQASAHLLSVINDVLDMSKIEAGKLDLILTEFNPEQMIIKATNVVMFKIEEKHQNFIVKLDDKIPTVISDEFRLNQVLTNLLSNAVKFSPENGTITLTVKKVKEDSSNLTLTFIVQDTGIGISKEQQPKLFNAFEQADGGVSRKYGGTGLGLAISKKIVNLMGGDITVESEAGKGASFSFTLTVKKGKLQEPPKHINWENLKILAVDDDPNVQEYFKHLSQNLPAKLEVTNNAENALATIKQKGPFDIIFIDWRMPKIDGIELTRQIKEKFGKGIVVIMISATEWGQIEKEAKQAGVDKFIPKPLFSSVLVSCIEECIGQNRKPQKLIPPPINQFKGKHILLAEDIDINREIVTSMLEDTGIIIDYAENGQAAFDMFKNNPDYNAILMDIHMPEVSGYEASKMIRNLNTQKSRNIPIIAITANVFKEDIEACLNAGMNAHIAKPLNLSDVLEKLSQFLK